MPGSPPIRHALKTSFPCEYYLYYDENTGKGYRWPAGKDDSGAATRYNGSEPEAQIGCLRALPPAVDIPTLGLQTEPGRKIAWTLQNYGAYQVEQVPWSRMMIVVEEGPDGYVAADFEKDYGYSMTTTDKNNPWFEDMIKLYPHLCIVANNAPGSIGGGGTPLSPLAPPFGSGTVENSPPTVRFIQPTELDVFVEPANLGGLVRDEKSSVMSRPVGSSRQPIVLESRSPEGVRLSLPNRPGMYPVRLSLHDMRGRCVRTWEVSFSDAKAGRSIHVTSRAAGMCVLRVSRRGEAAQRRVVLF